MQILGYIAFRTQEDIRCDAQRREERPCEGLVVHKTDEPVMEVSEIARECEELLIRERLEIALGLLKQE